MFMFKKKKESHSSACGGCSSCGGFLSQMGVDLSKWDFCVALAGNPNTGKSTVFNALTGLRQHTGNWPGKTVTRAEGAFRYEDKRYKLIDLPGTYSLLSTSTDEEIARDFILFGQPDCTVIVVDATCLERNLNLVLQVLEITDKAVVCLNLMDEAKRKGIEVDHRMLARDLGVPVIPVTAKTGEGLNLLLKAVHDIVTHEIKTTPYRIKLDPEIDQIVKDLSPMIKKTFPNVPNPDWIALRLLDNDSRIQDALFQDEFSNLQPQRRDS